jgi:ADP-ribosylglycohydrolase
MRHVLKPDYDRVKGCIFGCALGDALGLPAEGSEKAILAERYPYGLTLPHRVGTRGFPLNDWTDDTDQTALIMRTLVAVATKGAAPSIDAACDFARRLKQWYAEGFPELGDTFGMGCGGLTWRVLKQDGFETDPFGAAARVIGLKAGNGALMRTSPCAFTTDPAGWAAYFCATTHDDPLAVATCVAQSLLVRGLSGVPPGERLTGELLRDALEPALAPLPAAQRREIMEWASRSSLDALELDSRDARCFTLKTFACAVWAFRHLYAAPVRDEALFRRLLTQLVMEGGDADTNAAVAGACLGACLGYGNLPVSWLEALPHREWLEREVAAWYAAQWPPEQHGGLTIGELAAV